MVQVQARHRFVQALQGREDVGRQLHPQARLVVLAALLQGLGLVEQALGLAAQAALDGLAGLAAGEDLVQLAEALARHAQLGGVGVAGQAALDQLHQRGGNEAALLGVAVSVGQGAGVGQGAAPVVGGDEGLQPLPLHPEEALVQLLADRLPLVAAARPGFAGGDVEAVRRRQHRLGRLQHLVLRQLQPGRVLLQQLVHRVENDLLVRLDAEGADVGGIALRQLPLGVVGPHAQAAVGEVRLLADVVARHGLDGVRDRRVAEAADGDLVVRLEELVEELPQGRVLRLLQGVGDAAERLRLRRRLHLRPRVGRLGRGRVLVIDLDDLARLGGALVLLLRGPGRALVAGLGRLVVLDLRRLLLRLDRVLLLFLLGVLRGQVGGQPAAGGDGEGQGEQAAEEAVPGWGAHEIGPEGAGVQIGRVGL